MCTIAAKKLNGSWFLLKARDPVSWMKMRDGIKLFDSGTGRPKKLIVHNPDSHGDGYYGGMNEKGVAYVATSIAAAKEQVPYFRKPYVRLILNAPTAREAVEIIKAFNPRIVGNMFVADPEECYGIEAVPENYFIENIGKPAVKANHFLHLPDRNLEFDKDNTLEEWSHDHYDRAKELIGTASGLRDLQQLLRDRKNAENRTAICTTKEEDRCFTTSAFIFDTGNRTAYYTQGNPAENEFKEFGF